MENTAKPKQKRNRRFFTESFKKELVWKLRTKQLSLGEVENVHNISKQLLKTWLVKFPSIGQTPAGIEALPSEVVKQVDTMLERIIVHRLEHLLSGYADGVNSRA